MLDRMRELARAQKSFTFETTLASRSFAPWIGELRTAGYHFHLFYIWLPDPALAVARVATRVRLGGHHVPEEVVRRRYLAGLKNFYSLYQPLANSWGFYDNSIGGSPVPVARGIFGEVRNVHDAVLWSRVKELGGAT